MEQVELKVKVVDGELSALQEKVNGLKNITLKVDADGATESIKKYSNAAKYAAKSSESLLQNISKFSTWYLIGGAVSGVIRSFKEAISTMKEVDSALATVQKVTGESEAVIKRLGDTAYETASKYGVAAQEYLEAAGSFAKAGYDNYDSMAELATKVQLVGDVTAETASQFILSANAAWKMEGNITRLSSVLDAANEIENNYATSIEKIADGLPIVASTAANANMSMEEVIASLGTITAVTQESGTKAATALRALILNLQGAVGEYEEGFQVTEESVQSLNGLLNIYAADAMKAADAAGTIINPLEAIAALSKAADDGLLNQAELFELLSSLGGKLRTNQLTALVTNFDMLNSMLETVETSAGSAERELDVMLNTWEAKTNILKNTWAEFISNLISTDAAKGGLDVLIGTIDFLDSGFGRLAVTVGTVTAAVGVLSKTKLWSFAEGIPQLIKDVTMLRAGMTTVVSSELAMTLATTTLGGAIKALSAAMLKSPLFWAAALTAGIYGIVTAIDAMTVSTEELRDHLAETKSDLEAQQSEYDQLIAKGEDMTAWDKERAKVLEEQLNTLKAQTAELSMQALKSYESDKSGVKASPGDPRNNSGSIFRELSNEEYANTLMGAAAAAGSLSVLTNEERLELSEYISLIMDARDAGNELSASYEKLIDEYIRLSEGTDRASLAHGSLALSLLEEDIALTEAADATGDFSDKTDELARSADILKDRISAVSSATKEYAEYGDITQDTLESLEAAFPGLTSVILDNKGALTEEAQEALNAENSFIELIAKETIFNNTALSVSDKIEALKLLARQAGVTAALVMTAAGYKEEAFEKNLGWLLAQAGSSETDTGGSSGGGGGGSSKDAELERRKSIVSFLESELSLYQQRGDAESIQIAKMREIQNALRNEAEYMRSIGASQEEINKLSEEWWQYQKQIQELTLQAKKDTVSLLESELSLYQQRGDAESIQIAKMREIQNALHDEAEYMRSIGASQEEINKLSEEWWQYQKQISELLGDSLRSALQEMQSKEERAIQEQIDALDAKNKAEEEAVSLAEKELAVQEALAALENARSERTVRQYNASTGQWEWVANEQNVREAEDRYQSAINDLNEFQISMQRQALEDQLDAISERYDAMNSALDALIASIASGAVRIEEALSVASSQFGISFAGTTAEADIVSRMKQNSAAWAGADEAGRKSLADENALLGASLGWTRGSDGVWYTQNGTRAYDTGGILTGVGGIKATRRDEMVLPPDITGRMLTPTLTPTVRERMEELRWLYGGGARPTSTAGTSIGSQHFGDTYSMNGITIGERQAKNTTVYDFVRMSRGLGIYKATN